MVVGCGCCGLWVVVGCWLLVLVVLVVVGCRCCCLFVVVVDP